jgi:hypothetical protein
MADPNFTDPSWDASWVSLYGWIYPSRWTTSDNELRNAISTTFRQARDMVGRLGPQVGEMEQLLEDWKEMLDGYGRTIKYWEADNVLEELKYILEEAQQQVEADRLLIASKVKPAKVEVAPSQPVPVVPKPKVAKKKAPSGADMSDDAAFANAMLGFNKATAKTPPSKVKPVFKPYTPPTPEQIWVSRQRQMANECDGGIKFGTHAVNQDSVLRQLALEDRDGSVWQYRSGPENSHLRIMKSNINQFWTKGLSHDEERRAGRFMVYRRVGGSSRFVHVSGQRHPEEDLG